MFALRSRFTPASSSALAVRSCSTPASSSSLASRFKARAVIATAGVLSTVAGSSFAAEGDIDVSKAIAYIAGGVVAAGLLTAAMLGLVALVGAGKKAMRAGT